eukprot:gnl/MRDRNA2_/MRDRNA2_115310_c0_seq1.p1 gnl/MRDRNA2_/MRDRNA2_115310_c0~~gnl/MRDRNA2_/MRDRNA2_115310_c0_seq1.p1  ORF type:complete len:610 (-),score=127.49 gnl/MRDRNA2_/MRDRNA2_115310_c0_seq1:269-2098(-)
MSTESIKLTFLSGAEIDLDPPAAADEQVSDLCDRIARNIGADRDRLVLRANGVDTPINSHHRLRDALGDSPCASITVILKTCAANDDEYVDSCDSSGHGLLRVDKIRSAGFQHTAKVSFPEPSGININMMPFIFNQKESVPVEFHGYWPLICACPVTKSAYGQIGYLTVHEGFVQEGATQRRAGLHVESPGRLVQAGKYHDRKIEWGCGVVRGDASEVEGGIFMASNVEDTCKAWDTKIRDPSFIGDLGSIEHLRDHLPEGTLLQANTLYWLTDMTPHEALPMKTAGMRQFFRVVAGPLRYWYANHSTANPEVMIGPETEILVGSKFDTGNAIRPRTQFQLQAPKYTAVQADGYGKVFVRMGTTNAKEGVDIKDGTEVQCLLDDGEWLAVEVADEQQDRREISSMVGWVKKRNIQISPSDGPAPLKPKIVEVCRKLQKFNDFEDLNQSIPCFHIGKVRQAYGSSYLAMELDLQTQLACLAQRGKYLIVDHMGMLGWIKKELTLNEAQRQLLDDILHLAEYEGSSVDVWDDIILKLSDATEIPHRKVSEVALSLVGHASRWDQMDTIRKLVRKFKIDLPHDEGFEFINGKVAQYFAGEQYWEDRFQFEDF